MDWFSKTLQFSAFGSVEAPEKEAVVVAPYCKRNQDVCAVATLPSSVVEAAKRPLALGDFKGAQGEVLPLYMSGGRLLLLGLGDEERCSVEVLRRAYGALARRVEAMDIAEVMIIVPARLRLSDEEVGEGIADGLVLAHYQFQHYKSEPKETQWKSVKLAGASKELLAAARRAAKRCEGVFLARNLINGNADDVTPQTLAAVAKALAKRWSAVTATVFGRARIEKEKMGLLLAVSRAAHVDPTFIIVSYRGAPKSKEHTVLVGKGVTYDTGGLNIKRTGSMETMKRDMSGAAAILGTIASAAALKLKVNVTAVVPAAENSIGSGSYKPGDVYSSYNGTTVEIGNTDAEGRLLLADALAYSVEKLKPTCIVDIATLTGAVVVALGSEAAGLMSNDESLATTLEAAGSATYERLWRLPLFDEYRKQLDSDIADIKNIGTHGAGTVIAAMFLREFVGEVPWAHIDIAGTAFEQKGGRSYQEKMATGFGVRLLTRWLEEFA